MKVYSTAGWDQVRASLRAAPFRATCGVAVGQIDSKMPQTGTPELVYRRRALVDTLKLHCCWGPNGVSVWVWQGGAPRIGRELAGGQPLSLSSKRCRGSARWRV